MYASFDFLARVLKHVELIVSASDSGCAQSTVFSTGGMMLPNLLADQL